MSLGEANEQRLAVSAQILKVLLTSADPPPLQALAKFCFSLARSIDFSLLMNDVPKVATRLPSLVKEVYQKYRDEASLQAAITMLMISVKNACRSLWFQNGDSEELLKMANELLGSFCRGINIITEVSYALNSVSKIIPRFYPQWKLEHLVISFEAKPGYDVLMSDFHIGKSTAREGTVRLFVARTDDLETSSCLINPPDVSFLVNGKGVPGRTNQFQDKMPQFPTDITKMLFCGTNIIQTVGYFGGSYMIAVCVMSKVTDFPRVELKEYIGPAVTVQSPGDPEVIEGPSRISLNCPISLGRIRTPVKGHQCKHIQCFDYDNFLEINARRPCWRCPICNQTASFLDLRIDQKMVKILQDVAVGATSALVSADGSWKIASDDDGTTATQQGQDVRSDSVGIHASCDEGGRSNSKTCAVDLTVENNDDVENNSHANYIEERKPSSVVETIPVSESFLQQPITGPANLSSQGIVSLPDGDNCFSTWSSCSSALRSSVITNMLDTRRVGTLESVVPTSILNPVVTDGTTTSPCQGAAISPVNQEASRFRNMVQVEELDDDLQILEPQPRSSIINCATERQEPRRQAREVPASQVVRACSMYGFTQPGAQASFSLPVPAVSYPTNLPVEARSVQANAESARLSEWAGQTLCGGTQVRDLHRPAQPDLLANFNVLSGSPSVPCQTDHSAATSQRSVNVGASGLSEWARLYLMNSEGVNPAVSHQTVSSLTASASGTTFQTQGGSCQSPIAPPFQQVAGSPTLAQVGNSSPFLRNVGVYNASQQPLLAQNSHRQLAVGAHHRPPPQVAVGIPLSAVAHYHSRILAAQRAAALGQQLSGPSPSLMAVRPQLSATMQPQSSHGVQMSAALGQQLSGSSPPLMGVHPQLSATVQPQSTPGAEISASDQGWRPLKRMRGSLAGNERTAAINQYLVDPPPSPVSAAQFSTANSGWVPIVDHGGTSLQHSTRRRAN